jgi:hypothetical protein
MTAKRSLKFRRFTRLSLEVPPNIGSIVLKRLVYIYISVSCTLSEKDYVGADRFDRLVTRSDRPERRHQGNLRNSGHPTGVEPLMDRVKPHVGGDYGSMYLCYNTFANVHVPML